ncbi:hypothetical protein BGZ80_002929 [Entomortierella chlamydospora]|uniref:TAFII55 protein conserved region domain-containing protein n=1 Tax=Entomortierella chlamydospora TaxID=101097 RepID=A0A9P6N2H3_9FUNG|nr:hypothetical protein BGZ79_003660 [Entomortierella chlamydospora]KAG0021167.1 hypothetical protein BGZ80_002929 [Entomortierella chlamydospora]
MSNPGTPGGGAGSFASGFQSGTYPRPIGTYSNPGGAPTISNANPITTAGSITSQPLTSAPAGTAPRKQLAAAAAAGAAATANKSGRAKAPYKKGNTAGTGKRGGRGGGGAGGAGRGGGRSSAALAGDDGEDGSGGGGATGGKDSDDDNEDEPEVSIEEQFILRLPPGEMCDRFREKVISREIDETTKLKFIDARRGTFTFEELEFATKLVDLPTIIEAQKTLNGKQMYKIADISQMLIVDPTPIEKVPGVKTEPSVPTISTSGSNEMPAPSALPPLKPSDYIWPDGLTNPLKNVRKRRFRKRVSKVAVEGVENEVERLLKEDSAAEEVQYEIREQIDGMDRFDSDDGATPAPEGVNSDMDMDGEMMEMDEDEEDEDEDEDDFLAELEKQIGGGDNTSGDEGEGDEESSKGAANRPGSNIGAGSGSGGVGGSNNINNNININKAGSIDAKTGATSASTSISSSAAAAAAKINNKSKGKSDDDDDDGEEEEEEDEDEEEDEEDDDDDDSGSEEDDEDEDEGDKEDAQTEKLLKDEIKEINGRVKDNEEKLQSAPNDILKRRFGSILDNLRKELELKTMQLEEAKERSKSKGK